MKLDEIELNESDSKSSNSVSLENDWKPNTLKKSTFSNQASIKKQITKKKNNSSFDVEKKVHMEKKERESLYSDELIKKFQMNVEILKRRAQLEEIEEDEDEFDYGEEAKCKTPRARRESSSLAHAAIMMRSSLDLTKNKSKIRKSVLQNIYEN